MNLKKVRFLNSHYITTTVYNITTIPPLHYSSVTHLPGLNSLRTMSFLVTVFLLLSVVVLQGLASPHHHTGHAKNSVCSTSGQMFVPHSQDCNKFFMCDGSKAILIGCPAGLYFDPTINVCNYPDKVKCKSST